MSQPPVGASNGRPARGYCSGSRTGGPTGAAGAEPTVALAALVAFAALAAAPVELDGWGQATRRVISRECVHVAQPLEITVGSTVAQNGDKLSKIQAQKEDTERDERIEAGSCHC